MSVQTQSSSVRGVGILRWWWSGERTCSFSQESDFVMPPAMARNDAKTQLGLDSIDARTEIPHMLSTMPGLEVSAAEVALRGVPVSVNNGVVLACTNNSTIKSTGLVPKCPALFEMPRATFHIMLRLPPAPQEHSSAVLQQTTVSSARVSTGNVWLRPARFCLQATACLKSLHMQSTVAAEKLLTI